MDLAAQVRRLSNKSNLTSLSLIHIFYINDSKTARQLAFTSTSDWYMNTSNIVSGRIDIPDGATIKIVPSNPANIDYIAVSYTHLPPDRDWRAVSPWGHPY